MTRLAPFFCANFGAVKRAIIGITVMVVLLTLQGCSPTAADSGYFGKTDPPPGQTLRYISGPEVQSIDPQVGTGQNEGRIYMALFEGLVIYDPKTMGAYPGIAEKWDINENFTEFTFHIRKNVRFSNGDPITADDFVWSLRRGLDPKFAAEYSYIAYPILYAEGYNSGGSFVRNKATGEFDLDPTTHTRRFVSTGAKPEPGKEFVPIRPEDIGVEAVDPVTVRYRLTQPSPYFLGMMAHQFFVVVHRKTIEKYGNADWVLPKNIVTSGPFHLTEWVPYDRIVARKDPMYWDAANVRLEEIRFYPAEDTTTIMNLYKAGAVDALENHCVPLPWNDFIRPLKDYMDAPEEGNFYIQINTTKPPMNDSRVRRAFSLSLDREALARFRRVAKPLSVFIPEGIYPGYPKMKGDSFDPKRAKQLLAEAGYRDSAGNFDPSKFPIDQVEYTYNNQDPWRQVAELLQSQWKQNLGLTVPVKNMETRTFFTSRNKLEYKGLSRSGWFGDYMDPYTFLSLFQTPTGNNGTGWWEKSYVAKLDDANRTRDPIERFRKLAEAEQQLLDSAAVIPIWVTSTDWMKKPYVKGMYPNPGSMYAWKFVYIEHDPSKWNEAEPERKP
jgi:oligopeptide transport system substrate-binding protein